MHLLLPKSLHYPITITELLKQPNDEVALSGPLFAYFYKTVVTEGDELGEEHEIERTFPTRYESPVEGVLKVWKVDKGTVIDSPEVEVAEIEELCSHSVQFAGMCTMCGKDMTTISYNTDILNAGRATISMIHDNTALTISQDMASRVEEDVKRRLLASRRLSLVVDLDQTIIHATVDPTVAEWQQDKENPNYEAVKDVKAFQLLDDGPGARGCWYYIKLRPGLREFLENVSKLYELHIYTMGTRAYAQHIAKIVDPDMRIFGDRILSRDESGSLTAKNLQRLFPVDTKMVVIIDDRGDVWGWNENLIRVTAYDFFVGIGDINSSFLPQKQELNTGPTRLRLTEPKPVHNAANLPDGKETEVSENGDSEESMLSSSPDSPESSTKTQVSALEQLVSMGGGDDPVVLQEQSSKQDEALAAQVEDRPLLQRQKALDAEDEAAAAEDSEEGTDDSSSDSTRPRHNLLQDNDAELMYLERTLRDVHTIFFKEYDRKLTKAKGGRLAELRGEKAARKAPVRDDDVDLQVVPDIKVIMPRMKKAVLEGAVLVFSGVVPLGTDIHRADIAIWAKSFGAQVSDRINKRTTHVIAARNRTAKVRQAASRPLINVVTLRWLLDSIQQWQWMDEEPYIVPTNPEGADFGSSGTEDKDGPQSMGDDGSGLSSSDEDTPSLSEADTDKGHGISEYDPEGVRPQGLEENHSPIDGFENLPWKEVDSELAEFLGSDGEDSDTESNASDLSQRSRDGKKRKRSRSSTPSEGGDAKVENGGAVGQPAGDRTYARLAKRQQMARERTTSLKAVANATDDGLTPSGNSENDMDTMDLAADGDGAKEGDNGDDDLQRELEEEMDRMLKEGDDGG